MKNLCYNCKHYDSENHICNNSEAFSINEESITLRDFDSNTVAIKNINPEHIMIPLNFGCIHHEKEEETFRYNYEDDDDDEYEYKDEYYNDDDDYNDYEDDEDEE